MRHRFLFAYLLFVALLWPAVAAAQNLEVRLEGTQLRISASGLNFITGDALKRLQDGASVTFTFRLGTHASRNSAPTDLVTTRFVVSYDLWEEKYAVTRAGAGPRSISYLSLAAAEKWCMDLLSLPITGMSEDAPFWVTLEYRTEDPATPSGGAENSRATLGALIDVFSQRPGRQQLSGRREATGGPFRLSDLRRKR
jgi:hypothetical protein